MERTRLLLTGALPMLLIVACATAFPVSWALVAMYRRAVRAAMRSRSSPPTPTQPIEPDPAPAAGSDPERLVVRILDGQADSRGMRLVAPMFRARWLTAFVYALAGAAFALVMAFGFLEANGDGLTSSRRVATLFWIYFWPTILAINLVAALHTPARAAVIVSYFAVLVLWGVAIGGQSDTGVGGLLLLWSILVGPATLMLAAFMTRRLRAVGPLVLACLAAAWAGAFATLAVFQHLSDSALRGLVAVGDPLGLGAVTIFYGAIVLGFLSFTLLGWRILGWLARRYERYSISDEFLQIGAIVLLFAAVGSISLALNGALWILVGFAAFGIWWAAARLGFRLTRGLRPTGRADLLLLRVFALGSRSERFFAGLQRVWLRQGDIAMIAGPDLAASNIEPHEFLQFVRGRVRSQFIVDARDLDARAGTIEDRVTPDGRHRVHEFFCFDDTWRPTLSRLVKRADVVIMDLRAFSARRQGCAWELTQLFETILLDRVALVIDDTTDQALLETILRRSWARTSPLSPNRQRAGGAAVTLFRCRGAAEHDLRPMLASLLDGARSAA
jgi:hypothetical protein